MIHGDGKISRRVALFMPSFSGGGAERVMVTLANSFVRNEDVAVDLIVLRNVGPFSSEVSNKVRIVELGAQRALFGVLRFALYLRRNNPDVVLTTMKQIALCAYLGRLLSLGRLKTRLFVREALAPSFIEENARFINKALDFGLRRVYKNSDAVISITPEMTRQLESRFEFKRLLTIGNPVVTPKFRSLMVQDCDRNWPWAASEPKILAVGRLTAQKDYATLIKAFALVCSTLPARLAIFGEGELRGELEGLVYQLGIADRVDAGICAKSLCVYG
jgi:glycosyltransferase involved in cell wall biosynthesis